MIQSICKYHNTLINASILENHLKDESFSPKIFLSWLIQETNSLSKQIEEIENDFQNIQLGIEKLEIMSSLVLLDKQFGIIFSDSLNKLKEKIELICKFCEDSKSQENPKKLGQMFANLHSSEKYVQKFFDENEIKIIERYENAKKIQAEELQRKLDNICKEITVDLVDENIVSSLRTKFTKLTDLVKSEDLKTHLPSNFEEQLNKRFTENTLKRCFSIIEDITKSIEENANFKDFEIKMITLTNLKDDNVSVQASVTEKYLGLKNTVENKINGVINSTMEELKKVGD